MMAGFTHLLDLSELNQLYIQNAQKPLFSGWSGVGGILWIGIEVYSQVIQIFWQEQGLLEVDGEK